MTPADVCVVIPTLNEAGGIVAAIKSASTAGQIIVVDAGSTDGTIDLVKRQANVMLIHSTQGRGQQLRLGATQCQRPVMLFLHGDCRLGDDALKKVADEVAGGKRWGAMRQCIDAVGFKYRLLERGNAARVRWLGIPFGDQAMFVASSLYHEVGGFEEIPLMEDVRLSQRLRSRHWPALLKCPVHISARRWQRRGVLRQTARNMIIQLLHKLGASPAWLAKHYR